jgi:putative phage-type endonuclease
MLSSNQIEKDPDSPDYHDISTPKSPAGISASEAAIIMGLNEMVSPYQLWMLKTGRAQPDDLSELPQVNSGATLEDLIVQEYAKRMNCKVTKIKHTLFHKDHPFILDQDILRYSSKIENHFGILECKFVMLAKDNWKSGSDTVPLPYIVQMQYQLAVTNHKEADLAVLIGGHDFRIYHFKRDETLISKIIEEVKAFWHCVETDTPPELRDRSDAA